jgi:transcription elongation factor GreA
METAKKVITLEGLKKYQEELEYLKVTARNEVAEKIKIAREQGDLSENAEYDAAKDEQRDIEARIQEIENILKDVEVITKRDVKKDIVSIGSKVKVRDYEYKENVEFHIVGSSEVDSKAGKISNESPLGKALLGHKVDDIVYVEVNGNKSKYKILELSK